MALNIDMLTSKYLVPTANLAFVRPVYDHVKYTSDMGMLRYEKVYSLYEAAPTPESPRILIRDDKGLIVGGRTSYPLKQLKLAQSDMDPAEKAIYRKISRQWGMGGNKDEAADMLKVILNERVYEPVYRIIEMPTGLNWKEFIDKLMNFNSRKDARLVRFFKATLLKGILMRYVAHGILSTNPATGKSSFYDLSGIRLDKVSANSIPAGELVFGFEGDSACLGPIEDMDVSVAFSVSPDYKTSAMPARSVRMPYSGDMLTITTKSGKILHVTPSHSLITMGVDGTIVPLKASDSKVGDALPVLRRINLPETTLSVAYKHLLWASHPRRKPVLQEFTVALDEAAGVFFGAFVSEGAATEKSLTINNTVKSYIDRAYAAAVKMFPWVNWKVRLVPKNKRRKTPLYVLVGNSATLCAFLIDACGRKARNKKVPRFAFSAPKSFKKAFLRAYYDGDGSSAVSPSSYAVAVHSRSRQLLWGVSLLLADLGVMTGRISDSQTCTSLKVETVYIPSFVKEVGSDRADNRIRFEIILKKPLKKDHHDQIKIPAGLVRSLCRRAGAGRSYGSDKTAFALRGRTSRQYVGRRYFASLVNNFIVAHPHLRNAPEMPLIRAILDGDVAFDEIKSVSKSYYEGDVYDIEVRQNNNFLLANGVFVHNSLIGYAKGKEEIYRGVIADQVYSIAIEQVEAQLFTNFFSYLLSFMESGKAQISTGGVQMQLEGTAPIIITANPVGYDVDRMDSFRVLVDKLSDNEIAMGRRLGLIIYGTDFDTVSKKGGLDELEWKKYFDFYRAVEERVTPILVNGIYGNQRFIEWMEQPIPGYDSKLLRTYNITDTQVHDFLEGHLAQGYRHLRGGAVAMAIVDNMDDLFELAEMNVKDLPPNIEEKLVKDAERDLEDLVNINKGSISNMSVLLQKNEKMEQEIFDSMPAALQEVILGVKAFKEKTTDVPITMPMKAIEAFLPRTKYPDVQKLQGTLMDSHQIYRALLKNHFGFHLQASGNELIISFTDAKMSITVHA